MKKINLVMAFVVAVLCLAACSKKGDCVCTTTMNGEVVQTVTATDVEEDDCSKLNVHQSMEGMTQNITCEFKG